MDNRIFVDFTINSAGGIPIYRQIFAHIHRRVVLGLLEPGTALPSIGALAVELKVAANTVARAYEELEVAGDVDKRRGFGTFVTGERPQLVDRQRRNILEQSIDALFAEARELNFTPDALMELLRRRQTVAMPGDVAAAGDRLSGGGFRP